jgi:hypothetical protein
MPVFFYDDNGKLRGSSGGGKNQDKLPPPPHGGIRVRVQKGHHNKPQSGPEQSPKKPEPGPEQPPRRPNRGPEQPSPKRPPDPKMPPSGGGKGSREEPHPNIKKVQVIVDAVVSAVLSLLNQSPAQPSRPIHRSLTHTNGHISIPKARQLSPTRQTAPPASDHLRQLQRQVIDREMEHYQRTGQGNPQVIRNLIKAYGHEPLQPAGPQQNEPVASPSQHATANYEAFQALLNPPSNAQTQFPQAQIPIPGQKPQSQHQPNFAASIAKSALDFLILDDIRTLQDPKAPVWAKGLALASFFPVGKVLKGGKLLTKVVGKSDDVLRHLANRGLNPQQIKKYKDFVTRDIPVHIYELPNGGKLLEKVIPGQVPGSYAHYEKYLDKIGETVIFGKRSYDPKKRFIHWREKKPFDTLQLPTEEKYLIRIKQLIEYNKL